MLIDRIRQLQKLEKVGIVKAQVTAEIDYDLLTTRSKNAIIRALRAGVRPRSGIAATVVSVLAEHYQLPIAVIGGMSSYGYLMSMRDLAVRNPKGMLDYLELQITTARLMGKEEYDHTISDLRRHIAYVKSGDFLYLHWCYLVNTDPQVFHDMVVKDALLEHEVECIEELVRDIQSGAKVQVSLNSVQ